METPCVKHVDLALVRQPVSKKPFVVECRAFACHRPTKGGKAFCLLHVHLNPYVAGLLVILNRLRGRRAARARVV